MNLNNDWIIPTVLTEQEAFKLVLYCRVCNIPMFSKLNHFLELIDEEFPYYTFAHGIVTQTCRLNQEDRITVAYEEVMQALKTLAKTIGDGFEQTMGSDRSIGTDEGIRSCDSV